MTNPARPLLQSIVELGRYLFGAAACSLAVMETDEEHLVFEAASGEGAAEVIGMRLPVIRGVAGWVVSSGEPIVIQDVRADRRFARDVAESTGYVPRSIMAMPMDTARGTLGVMEVLDRTMTEGRDDLALLARLSWQAALAVELAGDRARFDDAASPDAATLLAGLGVAERHAATSLLRAFVTYVERPGGPASVV